MSLSHKLCLLLFTGFLALTLWGLVLLTIVFVIASDEQWTPILFSVILLVGAFQELFNKYRAIVHASDTTIRYGAKLLTIHGAVLSLTLIGAWIGLLLFPYKSHGTLTPLPLTAMVGGIVGIAAYLIWKFAFPFQPQPRVRRGRSLTPLPIAKAKSEKLARQGELQIPWGGLYVPEHLSEGHFCVVGATGSGKTATLNQIMKAVLPRIQAGSGSRALIYDAKRDVLSVLKAIGVPDERIRLLNPFDARSDAWDMAKDIKSPAAALQLASILIPSNEGPNRYFTDAARAIMAGVVDAFILTAGEKWTFRDVVCVMQSYDQLVELLVRVPATKSILDEYFRRTDTLHDIRSTVAANIAMLKPIAALWSKAKRSVSLADWSKGEYILVLGNDDSMRATLDSINRVLFQRVTELLLAKNAGPEDRSWLFLDELKEAGPLPGFTRLLSKGRSFGVRVVIGFQDFEGLSGSYGVHQANEVTALCMNKAFLRMDSDPTASWAARTIGDAELREFTVNISEQGTSVGEHIVNRAAVLGPELLDLPLPDAKGFHGVFVAPAIGVFKNHVPYGMQKPPSIPDVNFQERSAREQYLDDFDDRDFERLGLGRPPETPPDEGSLFDTNTSSDENPMPRLTRDRT